MFYVTSWRRVEEKKKKGLSFSSLRELQTPFSSLGTLDFLSTYLKINSFSFKIQSKLFHLLSFDQAYIREVQDKQWQSTQREFWGLDSYFTGLLEGRIEQGSKCFFFFFFFLFALGGVTLVKFHDIKANFANLDRKQIFPSLLSTEP